MILIALERLLHAAFKFNGWFTSHLKQKNELSSASQKNGCTAVNASSSATSDQLHAIQTSIPSFFQTILKEAIDKRKRNIVHCIFSSLIPSHLQSAILWLYWRCHSCKRQNMSNFESFSEDLVPRVGIQPVIVPSQVTFTQTTDKAFI